MNQIVGCGNCVIPYAWYHALSIRLETWTSSDFDFSLNNCRNQKSKGEGAGRLTIQWNGTKLHEKIDADANNTLEPWFVVFYEGWRKKVITPYCTVMLMRFVCNTIFKLGPTKAFVILRNSKISLSKNWWLFIISNQKGKCYYLIDWFYEVS